MNNHAHHTRPNCVGYCTICISVGTHILIRFQSTWLYTGIVVGAMTEKAKRFHTLHDLFLLQMARRTQLQEQHHLVITSEISLKFMGDFCICALIKVFAYLKQNQTRMHCIKHSHTQIHCCGKNKKPGCALFSFPLQVFRTSRATIPLL